MKTKHCNRCDTTRQTSEFSKNRRAKDGLQDQCKECFKEYNAKNNAINNYRDKDGNWYVYELSTGHIGQTCNKERRLRNHIDFGRIKSISEHIVLAVCSCREEALDLEALYQSLSPNYDKPDSSKRLKQPV